MRKIIILSFICLFLTPQLTLAADTIYVGPTRTHTTIQAGIDAAADGDTVIVDPGTYTGPGNRDIQLTGKSITVRSDTGPENCTIDCQGTETEPHRGFNFSDNQDVNSVIDGFTIINGYTQFGSAGIDCHKNQNSTLNISNCNINNNTSFGRGGTGGGISVADGIYTIYNCKISDNYAEVGGGIHCYNSSPDISNCVITGNSADNDGGGIFCYISNPDIKNCTISGNSADLDGDGMSNYSSDPTLTNCILWGNSTSQIYNYLSTPVINYCCIQDWSGGGTGNFGDDPLLAPDGYHLLPGSPCVNAGDPSGDYTGQTDIDGQPRVMACRVDTGADEFTLTLVALEITGPAQVRSNSQNQYNATAHYAGGDTYDATTLVLWWVVPQTFAGIDQNGVLTTGPIDTPQNITLYAQYTEGEVTVEAQMAVQLLPPRKLLVPAEYDTIQAAIDAANTDETVLVADGTYTGPGNYNLDFLGKAITVKSQNGPENCIIDCNNEAAGFFFRNAEQENSVLDGLTITHAGSYDSCPPYPDPGPWLPGPDPICSSVGAIHCFGSNPTIKNCIITRNYYGRGITCTGGSPIITNCVISHNSDFFRSAELGGGIYCSDSSPTISNCTITNNRAASPDSDKGRGGGIYCRNSSPTITNSTISYNTAYSSYQGSYIPPGGGSPDVYGYGGGIFCDVQSAVTISNCTIIGNNARADGGAIAIWSGSATVTNSVIWNNSNSQIADIKNDPSQIADMVTAAYSNIEGGWQGEGNINIDPLLTWDGHLQAASPCINAGDPCYVPAPDDTDIDGESRISDGRLDMGSDEFSDTDGDGLPDWWELKYFADPNIADPADDPDSDQWPNIDEYINFTEPNVIPVVYYVNSYNNAVSIPTQSLDSQYITKDNIQDAVWACRMRHNDIVMLAPGTYTGYYNTNIDFYGKAITICSTDPQDPCVVAATIIDCQNIYRTRAFNLHSSEGRASLISGLTIANGNAYYPPQPSPPYPYEPPIWDINEPVPYYDDPNPSIRMGGAISCDIASPTIKNCILTANNAQAEGGAIYCYNAAPKILDCIISDNSSMEGAAIYCLDSSPEITDCDINGNSSRYSGGGIYCWQSTPTIANCYISANTAGSSTGGIYCRDSNAVITNCAIIGNKARFHGAAILCWDSNPTITNCTIADNKANNYSGGIFCSLYSIPILTNCILWNNAPEQVYAGNVIPAITYSNIQDGWTGQGNIDLPPSFVEPGFWDTNDTPADVNDDLWIDGDYYLLPDSPCIDTGDPCYLPEPNETDLDGYPRVMGGRIDMGAYETNYLEVPMKFTPQALNLTSGGKLLKAHFVLPEGFSVEDVDTDTPAVIELFGVESYKIKVLLNDEGFVKVEATFNRSDLCSSITTYDHNIEVMVTGMLTTGQQFYGTDIIKITDRAFDHLAVFVSHWLEADCRQPHWCEGADLNEDSTVNFLDFALLNRCCIEVIKK